MIARYLDAGFALVVDSGVATGVRLPSGRPVVMSHLPYDRDDRYPEREASYDQHRPVDEGVPLVCGHVHQGWAERTSGAGTPMVNVGVDVRGFAPTPLADIDALLG